MGASNKAAQRVSRSTRKRAPKPKEVKLSKKQVSSVMVLVQQVQEAERVALEARGRLNLYVQNTRDANGIPDTLSFVTLDMEVGRLVFTATPEAQ